MDETIIQKSTNQPAWVWTHKKNRTSSCYIDITRDNEDPNTINSSFRFEFRFEDKEKHLDTRKKWCPLTIEIMIVPAPNAPAPAPHDSPKFSPTEYRMASLRQVSPLSTFSTVSQAQTNAFQLGINPSANPSGTIGYTHSKTQTKSETDSIIEELSNKSRGFAFWRYRFSESKEHYTVELSHRVTWDSIVTVIGIQMKIVAKSKGYPVRSTEILREIDYVLHEGIKIRSQLSVIKIGTFGDTKAGKSSFINAIFQAYGKMARPANVIDVMQQQRGTLSYRVYSISTPLSPEITRPFMFIDTKGEIFDVEDKPSMEKLKRLCTGLKNLTSLDTDEWRSDQNNEPENKPDVALLTINACTIVSVHYQPSWPLTWIYSTSYSVYPMVGYLTLKKELERLLRKERSCYLLFTHMDMLNDQEKATLKQQLQQCQISDADVIYAAKTCKKEEMCDHWTEKTLKNYRQFIENLDVSY